MSRRKKSRQTPEWRWEQALIDAYYDCLWRQVLEPLYEKFQRWKAGELDHDDMEGSIRETYRERREIRRLFTNKRGFLVRLIQWDREWFEPWLADNPPSPGIELAPPPARASQEEETP